MALRIETFNTLKGGQSLFKALGHPLVKEKILHLLIKLQAYPRLAVYDPEGFGEALSKLYDLKRLDITGYYVQKYEDKGKSAFGFPAQLITNLKECDAVFILSFDASTKLEALQPLLPPSCCVHTLDEARLEDAYLTNPKKYLDPLNFATNFAFFRDQAGLHTRLVTTNYWSLYSQQPASMLCCLLNEHGALIARWTQDLGKAGSSIVLDSYAIKERFDLPDFWGQLFIQIVGAAGHDIVKYALDIFSDDHKVLSCTHDANAWPADLYAGLPAPDHQEQVILWIQNSHPCSIPANAISLNIIGEETRICWPHPVPAYSTQALIVSEMFPNAVWPQQLEITAGKYFVRPRYEIITTRPGKSYRLIAHVNVERTDLKPDPELPLLTSDFGKGFILAAPVLPLQDWQSFCLPTPMATTQYQLPLALEVFDATGQRVLRHPLGALERSAMKAIDVVALLSAANVSLSSGYGHMELMYDFSETGEGDGWLHGLFRYRRGINGPQADTSFGSHIFNTPVTYKNQPLSYRGTPPGLTTRLFVRLGSEGLDTHFHLIYPVSKTWHPFSQTQVQLMSAQGDCIISKDFKIPQSGSFYTTTQAFFGPEVFEKVGSNAYLVIRDKTCRLFGYHGVLGTQGAFSLDHLFGF